MECHDVKQIGGGVLDDCLSGVGAIADYPTHEFVQHAVGFSWQMLYGAREAVGLQRHTQRSTVAHGK